MYPTHIHPQGTWSDGETESSGLHGFLTIGEKDTDPTLKSSKSDGSKCSIKSKAERPLKGFQPSFYPVIHSFT